MGYLIINAIGIMALIIIATILSKSVTITIAATYARTMLLVAGYSAR